jgi:hypothetical protein
MGLLWLPGQDVDFLERLTRLERLVDKMIKHKFLSVDSLSSIELEAESVELRTRLDDLEENIIQMVEEISVLGEKVKTTDDNNL